MSIAIGPVRSTSYSDRPLARHGRDDPAAVARASATALGVARTRSAVAARCPSTRAALSSRRIRARAGGEDAGRAGGLGDAHDCAEVAGVLDVGGDDDERGCGAAVESVVDSTLGRRAMATMPVGGLTGLIASMTGAVHRTTSTPLAERGDSGSMSASLGGAGVTAASSMTTPAAIASCTVHAVEQQHAADVAACRRRGSGRRSDSAAGDRHSEDSTWYDCPAQGRR